MASQVAWRQFWFEGGEDGSSGGWGPWIAITGVLVTPRFDTGARRRASRRSSFERDQALFREEVPAARVWLSPSLPERPDRRNGLFSSRTLAGPPTAGLKYRNCSSVEEKQPSHLQSCGRRYGWSARAAGWRGGSSLAITVKVRPDVRAGVNEPLFLLGTDFPFPLPMPNRFQFLTYRSSICILGLNINRHFRL